MRFLLALSAVASILASSQAFLAPMPSTITSGRAAATISRDINSLPVCTSPSTLQQTVVSTRSMSSKRAALMKREVIPQLLFVAACAGAIIGYVATHIDEIKEKQKVAVERTMTEQNNNIRDAQASQRDAINKALKKQEDALKKINEDAKRRADDAARRR